MTISISRNGPVTTVEIDRPERCNAVDDLTAERLTAAFRAFERDNSARVAVLCGAGGNFCAGGDLKWVAETGGRNWLEDLDFDDAAPEPSRGPLGPTRLQLSKPTIAAVAGAAVAGGMELAMWCDIRVAEEDAFFGVYCRRWGIPLLDGGTVRLPRLVGFGRAMEIILTGRRVPAAEALTIGLCERVVPNGMARQVAEDMAHQIAAFPPECVAADRRSLYRQSGLPLDRALRQEFAGSLSTVAREGVGGARRFAAGAGRHGGPE